MTLAPRCTSFLLVLVAALCIAPGAGAVEAAAVPEAHDDPVVIVPEEGPADPAPAPAAPEPTEPAGVVDEDHPVGTAWSEGHREPAAPAGDDAVAGAAAAPATTAPLGGAAPTAAGGSGMLPFTGVSGYGLVAPAAAGATLVLLGSLLLLGGRRRARTDGAHAHRATCR